MINDGNYTHTKIYKHIQPSQAQDKGGIWIHIAMPPCYPLCNVIVDVISFNFCAYWGAPMRKTLLYTLNTLWVRNNSDTNTRRVPEGVDHPCMSSPRSKEISAQGPYDQDPRKYLLICFCLSLSLPPLVYQAILATIPLLFCGSSSNYNGCCTRKRRNWKE